MKNNEPWQNFLEKKVCIEFYSCKQDGYRKNIIFKKQLHVMHHTGKHVLIQGKKCILSRIAGMAKNGTHGYPPLLLQKVKRRMLSTIQWSSECCYSFGCSKSRIRKFNIYAHIKWHNRSSSEGQGPISFSTNLFFKIIICISFSFNLQQAHSDSPLSYASGCCI